MDAAACASPNLIASLLRGRVCLDGPAALRVAAMPEPGARSSGGSVVRVLADEAGERMQRVNARWCQAMFPFVTEIE